MIITINISQEMRDLLLAMNLGHSTSHPLAGWYVLTMLYQDGTTSTEPMTANRLVQLYNQSFREPEIGETMMPPATMNSLLKLLTEQARLINVSNRKVRERWVSGKLRNKETAVYRISSRGIEYVKMMHRVIEAENTVVANTARIGEYCQLVVKLSQRLLDTSTTSLYNDFDRMVVTYDDVMKGMRKLDVDLHDLAIDLAFNHGSEAAQHLRQMLNEIAIPAYQQMLQQAARIQALADNSEFAVAVARSRQGNGNIDTAQAIQDTSAMTTQRQQTQQYVRRQLRRLAGSFDPSTSGVQNSFDSIFLVFQTLMDAIRLLSREMEQYQRQSVDLGALTHQLDALMSRYQRLKIPVALPQHLPMDRHQQDVLIEIENRELTTEERTAKLDQLAETERQDLLTAGAMLPINRQIEDNVKMAVTEADNPPEAVDDAYIDETKAALSELVNLVMQDEHTLVLDRDLKFQTVGARDALVALLPATYYVTPAGFNVFGRAVSTITRLNGGHPIQLSVVEENFHVTLPFGFQAILV